MNKKYMVTYEDFLLKEGIFNTEDIGNTIEFIDKSIFGNDYSVIPKNDYKFHISFIKPTNEILDSFFVTIAVCGWYPSYFYIFTDKPEVRYRYKFDKELFFKLYNEYNITELIIVAEANHNISHDKSDIDVPEFLYHLAPMRVKDKILKYGLIPKSRTKFSYHDDRIFLFWQKEDYKELVNTLRQSDFELINTKYKNKPETIENFDISNIDSDFYKQFLIEIDTNINDLKDVMILNTDPNYSRGYFTRNNIFNENIKIIQENI